MVKKSKIGQITIKKIGRKFAVCISGTPEQIYDTLERAEDGIEKLRNLHGRRHYKHHKVKRARTSSRKIKRY